MVVVVLVTAVVVVMDCAGDGVMMSVATLVSRVGGTDDDMRRRRRSSNSRIDDDVIIVTGNVWGNLQTATKDAWGVFQEAMEAEGTYQSMGKSMEEITNLRQSFMQRFFDVRAER